MNNEKGMMILLIPMFGAFFGTAALIAAIMNHLKEQSWLTLTDFTLGSVSFLSWYIIYKLMKLEDH